MDRKRILRSPWFWVPAIIVVVLILTELVHGTGGYSTVTTSKAVAAVQSGNAKSVTVNDKDQSLDITLDKPVDGHDKITATYPADASAQIFGMLDRQAQKNKLSFDTHVGGQSVLVTILIGLAPFLIIGILFFLVMSQMQGGGSRVMNFGKSKAKLVSKDTPKTTFADVAGADEAIEELEEIKEFLENPAKFQAIGAKIPKGVLLYGPPGTGKTLLARAVAGEAGVPFYSISGSDFVEMFVGVGASRVRDLFEQAKSNAPAIVFVDEIDAVGRHRGAGMGGGHDEREQTLNQLLVEMDGFDTKGGVILIAATNRPDILDPALLRPGRFDRQIAVDRPDLVGRKAILRVHAKGKPITPEVNLDDVARRTPGFTGADLANVINEGALLTARANQQRISPIMLEEAIDRVVLGPQRKTRVISDKEKRLTAYHEGGHALVGWALPNADPVYKVTILARGRTGGHTLPLPTEDKYTVARSEMVDQLAFALGGRAAEELIFHEPTTGASSDIEKASQIARAMVTEYGMSAKLGAVKYGTGDAEPFMGRDYGHQRDYSDDVAKDIDDEVRNMIEGAHDEAWEILVANRAVLDTLVVELMEKETLNRPDIERLFAPVKKRPPHNTYAGFGKRTPSQIPPVEPSVPLVPAPAGSAASPGDAGSASGSSSGGSRSLNGYSGGDSGAPRPSPYPHPGSDGGRPGDGSRSGGGATGSGTGRSGGSGGSGGSSPGSGADG